MTGVQGFRRRHNGFVMPLILAMLVLGYVPSLAFKAIWLDLRSVEVSDDLVVTVDRSIKRNFTGSFTVEVRRSEDHRLMCSGEPEPRLINYKKRAGLRNPISFSFRDWASFEETWEPRRCVANGLIADTSFYIETCHFSYGVFGIQLGKRCVRSNDFTPTGAAISRMIEH